MRTVKFTELITQSIERTKLILFQPFLLKKWLKLLFIGVLAGAVTAGGLGGGPGQPSPRADAWIETHQTLPKAAVADSRGGDQSFHGFKKDIRRVLAELSVLPSGILIGASIILVFVLTGLMLLFTWLNARFKFVWLHAAMNNDAAIAKPFNDYRKEGNSFFKLAIVVGILALVFMGLLGGWIYFSLANAGFFKQSAGSFSAVMMSLAGAFIIFIAGLLLVCIWGVFLEHCVVPIMALNKETYLSAWTKFSKIYEHNKGDCWLYLLVLLGLGIVCSILAGIIVVVVLIVSALGAGIVFGIGYLVFYILLKAKILFWGFAIGAGIPLFIAFILIMFSIFLPFAVFFRCFSLYFLSSLNEGYMPLLLSAHRGEK